jgi:hypothetical protein
LRITSPISEVFKIPYKNYNYFKNLGEHLPEAAFAGGKREPDIVLLYDVINNSSFRRMAKI